MALLETLNDLAELGPKRVGTPGAERAAEYLRARMTQAGLADVHIEEFEFPRHDVLASTFTVTIDAAQPMNIGYDVFEGSGSGLADGEVMFVGLARPSDLAGKDLRNRIALVERSATYHRSTQYLNVIGAGAAAMLYISTAGENLRQLGSVRRQFESMGLIPAITIGQVDGMMLRSDLEAGKQVRATIDVVATTAPARGRNVIGRILGADGSGGQIVIGAHYDTWETGSVDNGGGVAALLALAERRVKERRPHYTLVFVAYDGEEVALYGGYDYLRRHQVIEHDPILAVLNFEMPSSKQSTMFGLAYSNHEAVELSLRAAELEKTYTLFVPMDVVPLLFGGIIPTDIQGIYRSGVPTASTAVDSPWYHTSADTPDKVDLDFLADAIDNFDTALAYMLAAPPEAFGGTDTKLWRASVSMMPSTSGGPLLIDAAVTDANGEPQPGANVAAVLLVDDFFQVDIAETQTDASGRAQFSFAADRVAMGRGRRFVHVTAGRSYPLVEAVLALP